jgi:lipoic acid synthetase
VLSRAKSVAPARLVKSSIMVGIGEEDAEVHQALADLRAAGTDIVTLGQYLRPSPKHAPVARYVPEETFVEYQRVAEALGFSFVASGPLVRSSYHAAEGFVAARLRPNEPPIVRTPVGSAAPGGVVGGSSGRAAVSDLIAPASLVRR